MKPGEVKARNLLTDTGSLRWVGRSPDKEPRPGRYPATTSGTRRRSPGSRAPPPGLRRFDRSADDVLTTKLRMPCMIGAVATLAGREMHGVGRLARAGRDAVDVRIDSGDFVAVLPVEGEAACGASGWVRWCAILSGGHEAPLRGPGSGVLQHLRGHISLTPIIEPQLTLDCLHRRH